MIGFLIQFVFSISFMFMGWLIWKKGWEGLIYSLHRNNEIVLDSYRKAIGRSVFGLGIVILITGILSLFKELSQWVTIGFLVIGISVIIYIMVRIQKKYHINQKA